MSEFEQTPADREDTAQAFSASEERFRSLIGTSPFAMSIYSPDGKIAFANRALQRLFRVSDDVHARIMANYNILEDPLLDDRGTKEELRRAFRGEFVSFSAARYRASDFDPEHGSNEEFWLEGNAFPVLDENQQVREIVIILVDITERRQAQIMLEVQHDLAQSLSVCTDLGAALSACVDAAAQTPSMDAGGVFLVDATKGSIRLAFSKGISDEFRNEISHFGSDSRHARIVQQGVPQYLPEAELRELGRESVEREGLRSLAVIPVSHEGNVVACLNMCSRSHAEIPQAARIVLESIGAQMGGVIVRLQMQEELRREHDFSTAVLDTARALVIVLDLEGRIVVFNRACEECTGYRYEEVHGRPLWEFLLAEHEVAAVKDVFGDLLENGLPSRFENVWLSKQGNPKLIQWANTILKERDGSVRYVIGTGLDITEKRAAEEALKKNEANFRSILDNMAEAIVIHDIDSGELLDMNPAMLTMFDVTRDDALQMSVQDFSLGVPPYTEQEAMVLIQRAASGVPQLAEWRARRSNGELFWVEVAVKKAMIGGQPCVLAVLRDVSERKETEENIRRMEDQLAHVSRLATMGEMVAGVAHEVNQPLYAIKNFATASSNFLAAGDQVDVANLQEMNERIINAAQRAGEIIMRMRGFARLTESERSVCRLHDVVTDSVQLVAFEARRHNVQIDVQNDESVPVVHVDRVQIQQVLVNLLQNAFEAFEGQNETPRRIQIRIESEPAFASVAMTDNGHGLTASDRDVFDPFVTTKPNGMGLGLAISRTILEAHAGTIEAIPHPEQGTTFRFLLPLA